MNQDLKVGLSLVLRALVLRALINPVDNQAVTHSAKELRATLS